MKRLKWSSKLSVGVPSLDQEHNRIVSIINQLIEKIAKEDVRGLNTILYELLEYSQDHFRHEERLFVELNYEGYSDHKTKHEEFITQIKDFAKEFISTKESKQVKEETGCRVEITEQGSEGNGSVEDTVSKEKLALASNIVRFLFDWLINHVLNEDKKYSKLLISKGAR